MSKEQISKSNENPNENTKNKADEEEEKMIPLLRNDPRFVQTNQTQHCYNSFVDFHRCSQLLGEEDRGCQLFKRTFTAFCPNQWVEKWNEQLENGTFPEKLTIQPAKEEHETNSESETIELHEKNTDEHAGQHAR